MGPSLYNCNKHFGVSASLWSLKGQFRINPLHITFTSAVSVQIHFLKSR